MHIALVLHTIHSSSQWVSGCLMRTLINCRALFSPQPIFFSPYWITKSAPSFVHTTLKAHSLFFCMPYYVLSSSVTNPSPTLPKPVKKIKLLAMTSL